MDLRFLLKVLSDLFCFLLLLLLLLVPFWISVLYPIAVVFFCHSDTNERTNERKKKKNNALRPREKAAPPRTMVFNDSESPSLTRG